MRSSIISRARASTFVLKALRRRCTATIAMAKKLSIFKQRGLVCLTAGLHSTFVTEYL